MGTRVCGLALAALLLAPGAAAAHAHRAPEAVLVTADDSEPGALAESAWAIRTGRECVIKSGRGEHWYPKTPVRWVPGSEIAVRFETGERPRSVTARAFLLGDPTTSTPVYGEVSIPHELRRVEIDGETMWEAVLSPPPWFDLYMEVGAEWKRAGRCGPREATWVWRAGLLPI